MSSTTYEYLGQVYSPAFSDPPSPPESPMSSSSDASMASTSSFSSPDLQDLNQVTEESEKQQHQPEEVLVNRKPKFPTRYHELLQPLQPATTLPVRAVVPTRARVVNTHLQSELSRARGLDVEAFLRLHGENVDVNAYDSDLGQTALHSACGAGDLEAARALVKYGADLSLTNRDGFSALHLAAFSGNSELLSYLFKSLRM